MRALWAMMWRLVALRAGPEDMPYSRELLWLMLAASVALGLFSHWLVSPGLWQASIGLAAVSVGADALALWLMLRFKRVPERFVQSLTAVYGADALLSLCALVLVPVYLFAGDKSPLLGIGFLAEMLIVGWGLGVRGFIYHRALNIGIFQGNMLSMALFFATLMLALTLFPELAHKASA